MLSTKSERSAQDAMAPMGMGATNTMGRVMASVGLLADVPPQFGPSIDVANAGVLLALPALLANGLLKYIGRFRLPAGYYSMASIFVLLALMALCRLKHPESLRYCAPGEWGKLLGLDRVPEVRTLREKLSLLSKGGEVPSWTAKLCEDWMAACPQAAGLLYVDGHVRVYHGAQTELPRHYVARERLCLRATTDYWVNAMDGQPFFRINQAVDPGLQKVLTDEVIPRLIQDVPGQPCEDRLENDPLLHRFTLVFDREGYGPDLLLHCKRKRVACLTYHKYPGPDWPHDEFVEVLVTNSYAPPTKMKLAERGTCLSNGLWVRELRKLSDSGHQTSILSTDYSSDLPLLAASMFSRWCQENFFRYMREHFSLDRLIDYQTEPLSDTTRVVNPDWRSVDSRVRTKVSILQRKLAQFGAMELEGEIEPARVQRYMQHRAELQEDIACMRAEIEQLKVKRKDMPRHLLAADLPEDQRFRRLSTKAKDFIDAIKMIAYRAETAMAHTLRDAMSRADQARSLLRQLYLTEADILPDLLAGTLTIRIHHMANKSSDTALRHLLNELNATETEFPGTNLRLVYELVPNHNRRDQGI